MEYLGEDVQTACDRACQAMTDRLQQTAGVIALDKRGNVGIAFTTKNMAWAYQKGDEIYSGVDKA
jgi:beta-aspartyl-peptidase (threonine type)